MPMTDPEEMRERLQHDVDLVVDGGNCGFEPTTVINFQEGVPVVTRLGRGDVSQFQL